MVNKVQINNSTLSVVKADVTDYVIDAFVFYARNDLKLGSGFGNAIALRGGPSIRKELEKLGPLNVTEVVMTTAGDMKAGHIIHANGPKFQEENTNQKLKTTIINALKIADAKGMGSVAFPPMGAGFYGVPLEISAKITIETIADFLSSGPGIKEVVVCGNDNRELKALQAALETLKQKAA
ncbi:MAG: macro domain-containing protein [Nitrospiraceae bacterium]|nr:MAG: macro domain-containing protein [Nitrospiraceae bacterium]